MNDVFTALKVALEAGHPAVLVTVIESSGSAPRGAGAHMLITEEGRAAGTIGGGQVERRCEQAAYKLLGGSPSQRMHFALHPEEIADMDMICGGEVSVFFRPFPGRDPQGIALADRAASCRAAHRPAWLVMELRETADSAAVVCSHDRTAPDLPEAVCAALGTTPQLVYTEERTFYCAPLSRAGMLYIFGGGHVGQALAQGAALLDLPVTVLDDRAAYINAARFPQAARVLLTDYTHLPALDIGPEDGIVIVTRGHLGDLDVLRWAIRQDAGYIGMIGSKRKRDTLYQTLRTEGTPQARLSQVHSPIGLDIGAETPGEIAVAILAELVAVRARCKKEDKA